MLGSRHKQKCIRGEVGKKDQIFCVCMVQWDNAHHKHKGCHVDATLLLTERISYLCCLKYAVY